MFLLDTNVLSELRRYDRMDPRVRKWIRSVDASTLFISVITVMEIENGVLRVERRDPAQGKVMRSWAQKRVVGTFSRRILPVDLTVAIRCAALHVPNPQSEHDALIAATALVHKLQVVTRNVNDFAPMGVGLINPWD